MIVIAGIGTLYLDWLPQRRRLRRRWTGWAVCAIVASGVSGPRKVMAKPWPRRASPKQIKPEGVLLTG
jgi:hypothetical protein